VHSAAVAVFKGGAVFTDAGFCPFTVSHNIEAVIPYVKKIIIVDVSLNKTSVDVRTS